MISFGLHRILEWFVLDKIIPNFEKEWIFTCKWIWFLLFDFSLIIALTITKLILKMPLDSLLQLWRRLKVPESGLAPWSWLGYGQWSLVNPWSKFWSMSFKSWLGALEDAGGFWMFLKNLDLDLDMVSGLWYTHVPNFGSLSWFWRCKDHPCLYSPDLASWRMLEVSDGG